MVSRAPPPTRTDDPTATAAHRAPRAPLGAVVRVVGQEAEPFRLGAGSCVVGSGAGVDLVVVDPQVSRRHVELHLVPEGVELRDLESRNGTFYLGQRVEKIVLALGSQIRIGGTELRIDPDTAALGEGGGAGYGGLLGTSPAMRSLFATLARLEGSLVTVLVEGESGAGKELVARALHDGSLVGSGPLVVLNCGAIARELVLSELFGHRKGAFTGAFEERRGAFEDADGGTLFLDEVGELPLDVQPTLLRALESGESRRVGENQARRVKVRIVAATNRDLEEEVRRGRFRQDLFYRLAVIRLRVPPLRERAEDIGPLARHFAQTEGLADLPVDAVGALSACEWPGNVRQLKNAVQAYVALGALPVGADDMEHRALDAALERFAQPSRGYAEQKDRLLERFTKTYLRRLLLETRGNQSEAARVSGLDRGYLRKLLAKLGDEKES